MTSSLVPRLTDQRKEGGLAHSLLDRVDQEEQESDPGLDAAQSLDRPVEESCLTTHRNGTADDRLHLVPIHHLGVYPGYVTVGPESFQELVQRFPQDRFRLFPLWFLLYVCFSGRW